MKTSTNPSGRPRSAYLPYLNYKLIDLDFPIYQTQLPFVLAIYDHIRRRNQIGTGIKAIERAYEEYLAGKLRDRNGEKIPVEDEPIQIKISGVFVHFYLTRDCTMPFLEIKLYIWQRTRVTPVVFYKLPDKDIMAYFPDMLYNFMGCTVCYSSSFQHACCSPEYARNLPLASAEEYTALLNELQAVGYENLKVQNISNQTTNSGDPATHP